jgi:hypothetical protein
VHARSRALLESGTFRVNERFKGKSPQILSAWAAWIVSQQAEGAAANAGSIAVQDDHPTG